MAGVFFPSSVVWLGWADVGGWCFPFTSRQDWTNMMRGISKWQRFKDRVLGA